MLAITGLGNQPSCWSVVLAAGRVGTTTSRRARRWARGRVLPRAGAVRWTGERSCTEFSAGAVGDGEIVGGPGDGDNASMVQPVVIGAYQHQVEQLGGAAVLPVPDMVCVQTAGGPTTRNRTRGMAVLSARRSRRLIWRVARPAPMTSPSRSNQTSQVASQVRYRRSASVSSGPRCSARRAARRRRAPPRWCDAHAAGGPPRRPTRPPPGA